MNALDRLIGGSKGQQGTSFESNLRIERNTRDIPLFAKYNDNTEMSSLSSVAKQVEGEITISEAISNTVIAMRGQEVILRSMALSITDDSLNAVANVYNDVHGHKINIAGVYHSSNDFKLFVNAMANGFLVTAGIEKTIPNNIKLYFQTPLDVKSMDMNIKAGYQFKGNLPCVTAFDTDSVNRVQAFVRTVSSQVSTASKGLSLFDFINTKGVKFKTPFVSNNNILSEQVILKSMDVKQLAGYLTSKFNNDLDKGLQFAQENGVDDNKLQRVSMLIKAVRDYTN